MVRTAKELYDKNKQLIQKFGLFLLSSGTSFVLDILLFQLFVFLFKGRLDSYVVVSTVLARILSSLYNYTINRIFVFRDSQSVNRTVYKYYILCICQMMVSAVSVDGLFRLTHLPETFVKIAVDCVLCVVSFYIQRRFVFSDGSAQETGITGTEQDPQEL